MYKLGYVVDGNWVEHSQPAVFQLPDGKQEVPCLAAGVPGGDPYVFSRLVSILAPPYHVLYVLHTPRGEGPAGRYQSPLLSAAEFHAFISEFELFLKGDGRFDVWAYSPEERATVVWDRHNRIFAYGPISRFERTLREMGFSIGSSAISFQHAHHYHAELDEQASRLLRAFDWQHTPLREEDTQ